MNFAIIYVIYEYINEKQSNDILKYFSFKLKIYDVNLTFIYLNENNFLTIK